MDEIDKWIEEIDFLLSKQGQEIQEFIEAIELQQKKNKKVLRHFYKKKRNNAKKSTI